MRILLVCVRVFVLVCVCALFQRQPHTYIEFMEIMHLEGIDRQNTHTHVHIHRMIIQFVHLNIIQDRKETPVKVTCLSSRE